MKEDADTVLSRFRSGLRQDLQKELIPHRIETLTEMFEKLLDFERYLQIPSVKRFEPRGNDLRPNLVNAKSNPGNPS